MRRKWLAAMLAAAAALVSGRPAAARTTCLVENGRMVVTMYIAFQGASDELIERWAKEIREVWNGPKGWQGYGECGHQVRFVVVTKNVPAGERFPQGYHRVEVKPYDGTEASLPRTPDGQVAIAYMGKSTRSPSVMGASIDGVWSTRSSAPVDPRKPKGERFKDAAHEAGHMMGLPDYYNRKAKWQGRNLMGHTDGRWAVPAPPLICGIVEAVTGKCYCLVCPSPSERPPLKAVAEDGLRPGLNYRLYEGKFAALPDFAKLQCVQAGQAGGLDLGVAAGQQTYAVVFWGYIEVPRDGCYTFHLRSNDGSRLKIGGKGIADNDGTHGMHTKRGQINLKAGRHAIEVAYFSAGKGGLELRYDGVGVGKQLVPDTAYFCKPAAASPTTQAASAARTPRPATPAAKR